MHSIEHKVSSIGTLALHFSKLVPINTTWNVKVTYKHCVVKSIMPTLNSISLNTVTMFITDTFSFNSCSRTNLSMKGSWMFAQTYLYSNWVNMDKTLLTLYSLIVKDNKIQDVGTPLHANDANFGARIVRTQSPQCVLVLCAGHGSCKWLAQTGYITTALLYNCTLQTDTSLSTPSPCPFLREFYLLYHKLDK